MNNNFKSKRTEAVLSLLVTSAIVITLAIAVASAVKKGSNNNQINNMVNLNETESETFVAKSETPEESIQSTEAETDTNTTSDIDSYLERNPVYQNPETIDVEVISPDAVTADFSFSEADTLIMPVSGEIILPYNMDNTIWFPTLGVYKCNPAMYIGSEIGTEVVACAPGKVIDISYNEETGNTVKIDMGNNYIATYGQLDEIRVSLDEVVLSGATIGTVALPTIYYTNEGSGVYFQLTQNNIPDNPLDYME